MKSLTKEILSFLQSNGFDCSIMTCNDLELISTCSLATKHNHTILPLSIEAGSIEEAARLHENTEEAIRNITAQYSEYPLIITEDRWHLQPEAMQKRILAHLEIFNPIYARNCEVRRIDKALAKEFLEASHSYGHAACKYCYGLFLKRHTGHIAEQIESATTSGSKSAYTAPDTLVAVATFSNARKWVKGDKTIRSYEWTRYASLPNVRLSGGMGRMLKTFIKEVQPDDIMSYADLEWSAGDVYTQLGFTLEGHKAPVLFLVDTATWKRSPIKSSTTEMAPQIGSMTLLKYFKNFGSNKYRLKLTDYK